MADRRKACSMCGSFDTYRIADLQTRPIVYGCEQCVSLFTVRGGVPAETLREIRRGILQRWDQLADDLHHLIRDIREAPDGTFGDEERDNAVFELDNTVWDVMVNDRPRLPRSEHRPASREFRREFRRLRVIREYVESGDYEKALREQRQAIKEGAEKAAASADPAPESRG